MAAPSLMLASFAPSDQDRGLRGVLADLGYHVETVTQEIWFEPRVCWGPHPLVLFLAQPSYPRERILSVLSSAAPACLGLCGGSTTPRDVDILSRCSEFACWPCDRDELALRLERLPRAHTTPPTPEGAALIEEFVHLNMIGSAPAFVEALRRIKKIARCDLSTLIQGETGTGKELAARAMHYMSARRDRPFIPVNCGAIPDDLIENELFGHARGAFTDAKDAQPGVVALAEGGTLFLDEIEALSPKAQVALLRFLQDRQYRVLGGRALQEANVRVIAAGNDDLAGRVHGGRFREDLYFRLHVASVRLPPLRERPGDIYLLAEHLCTRYRRQYNQPEKTLHPESLRWLARQPWPGNVRELEHLIHREFVFADGDHIVLGHEPAPAAGAPAPQWLRDELPAESLQRAKAKIVTAFERHYLSMLLEQFRGNITRAARRAGTERRALGKLLKKYGIDAARYRGA